MALILSLYNPCILYYSINNYFCKSIINLTILYHFFITGFGEAAIILLHCLTIPLDSTGLSLTQNVILSSLILNLVVAVPERASGCPSVPRLSVGCPGAIRASGDVGGAGRVSAVRGKDWEGRGSAASADCRECDSNTVVPTGRCYQGNTDRENG